MTGDANIGDTAARVRVCGRDGRIVEVTHDLGERMPAAALEASLRAKSAALLGAERSAALWAAVADLSTARALGAILRAGT